jgi:hypothetical protein
MKMCGTAFLAAGLALLGASLVVQSASASEHFNVSQTPGASTTPAMVATSDGALQVLWNDQIAGVSVIVHRTWANGALSDPMQISSPGVQAVHPSLAIGPSGAEPFAAWEEVHGGVSRIYGGVFTGGTWTRFEIAPDAPGPQRYPEAYVRPDGSRWVCWRLSGTESFYACDGQSFWVVWSGESCSTNGQLVETPGGLAFVTPVQSTYYCLHDATLFNGAGWITPPGNPTEASGSVSAVSLPGSARVHLASSPGALPTCPCYSLVYTQWNTPDQWSGPEWLSQHFSDYYYCRAPDIVVDALDRPSVAYVYEELDGAWNTARQDVVLATRTGPGQWQRSYQNLPLQVRPENPVVALLSGGSPAVAWSGVWGGSNREIWLAVGFPVTGVPDVASLPRLVIEARPNPSDGPVVLGLRGEGSSLTRVAIFDAAGRVVRHLITEPGRPEVVWDGMDSGGHPVGAGVFFVGETGLSHRTTLVRTR